MRGFEKGRNCLGVYVGATADLRHLGDDDRARLQPHLGFAHALQIETRVLEGADVADTLVSFARQQRVTQRTSRRTGR